MRQTKKIKKKITSLGDTKLFRRWLGEVAASLDRRRRYVPLTPPLLRTQRIFDKKTREAFTISLRNTTDLTTFKQVILNEEYKLSNIVSSATIHERYEEITACGKTPLIVDCGANIGLSALYLSREFPKAKIVCIEPDSGNAEVAKRNTSGYPVDIIVGAIGGKSGRAQLCDPGLGDNAFRITANEGGAVRIFTIGEIFADFPIEQFQPFIVKVDIEGYERELFSVDTDWVEQVFVLAVELHDWLFPGSANSKSFFRCISSFDRDFQMRGDTAFSVRTKAAAPA